jgi:hypothetical protein
MIRSGSFSIRKREVKMQRTKNNKAEHLSKEELDPIREAKKLWARMQQATALKKTECRQPLIVGQDIRSFFQLVNEKTEIDIELEIVNLASKYPLAFTKGSIRRVWWWLMQTNRSGKPYSVEFAMKKVHNEVKRLLGEKDKKP